MESHDLVAASTIHKPKRNHTNATFMPRDERYKPVQLDYILCKSRWVTSVTNSKVRWGPAIQRWGRKFDHGLVECNWRVRICKPKKMHRPDFSALKNTETAQKFDATIREGLQTDVEESNPSKRLKQLNDATKKATSDLPSLKPTPFRKRLVSQHTRSLIDARAKRYQGSPVELQERKAINKEISRSCREDYRAYISSVVDQIGKAADCGNLREVSKLTKSISSDKKTSSIMPSKGEDGTTFTSSKQLLDSWEKFMTDKFACADSPGVTYNPGLDQRLPEEDLIPREEFDECVQALRSGKAPGWDGAPIEVYLASESAYNKLYCLPHLVFRMYT